MLTTNQNMDSTWNIPETTTDRSIDKENKDRKKLCIFSTLLYFCTG